MKLYKKKVLESFEIMLKKKKKWLRNWKHYIIINFSLIDFRK